MSAGVTRLDWASLAVPDAPSLLPIVPYSWARPPRGISTHRLAPSQVSKPVLSSARCSHLCLANKALRSTWAICNRFQSLAPTQPSRPLQSLPRSLHPILQVGVATCPSDSDFPSREILYLPFSPIASLEEESNQVFKLVSSPSLRCLGSDAVSSSLARAQREVI